MSHLIHVCQSSARLVMLGNLVHSCSRVQQLLVRVIFLLGMSDGCQSDSSLHIPLTKSLRGYSSGVTVELNQVEYNRLIRFIGKHLAADSAEQANAGPAPKPAFQGALLSSFRVRASESHFADQLSSEENAVHKVLLPAARFAWSRPYVGSLFLPGISRGREVVGHRD
jgi:hypothetical protein